MTTPSGQISAQDIKNEFGEVSGTVPLGSYRVSQTKGALTLAIGDGIPTSGAISFDNMRNKKLNIVVDYYGDSSSLNRTDNGDNTMNAKTRYNDQNNRVSVIGGLKSKPSDTSPHRVRIHVNQNLGGKSGEINTVALRTGSWNSGTDLIVDVGGEGAIYGGGGAGGQGYPGGAGGSEGNADHGQGPGSAGDLSEAGEGGGGGNNGNQAYSGAGGEGGSQGEAADNGAGAQYGSLGGGAEGSAIRKASGVSFTLNNSGSVVGNTDQTGVA